MVINNRCGSCTFCCEALPIIELKKPPSTVCKNCIVGTGCAIYDSRPVECRNFDCMYVKGDEMGEDLRPDNSNVMFEYISPTVQLALSHHTDVKLFNKPNVVEHIKKLNKKGISVISSSFTTEPKNFFLAEGHTKEHVWRMAMTELGTLK